MAEFNGKQGHWVTVSGRHIFIADGHSDAPKVRKDIGERLGKNYDVVKDDFKEIFDYLTADTTRQKEFLEYFKQFPYVGQENLLDVSSAFRKNDPMKIYNGAYTTKPLFIRAYAKMADPNLSDEDLDDLPLPTYAKRKARQGGDLIDKQDKEIKARAKQAEELNVEKKSVDNANQTKDKQKQLVDKYRKELKDYMKNHNGKLPRQIYMGTTTVGRDAVLSAINAEYELNPKEDKMWDRIQFQNKGGVPYIWLPGKQPISTLGLSNSGIAGLRKWLAVWGAEHLDD